MALGKDFDFDFNRFLCAILVPRVDYECLVFVHERT